MTTLSALTIARGRPDHLRNVIKGFAAQTRPPDELIIGAMQSTPYRALPKVGFPIRQIEIPGEELPLSKARNMVANAASGDILTFVDVDCIPAPDFVEGYLEQMAGREGIFMGEVRYLPAGSTSPGLDFSLFADISQRHSDRRGPPQNGPEICEDYKCFWSLNFALHAKTWQSGPHFDERFTGYGGEDTDFARMIAAQEIPIWWIRGGRVYHQHHLQYMPPIHNITSVVRNAEIFAAKWGHRTMEHWLHAYRLMGLIEARGSRLHIVREPTEAEFDLCRQEPHMPYANTRRVIDMLERVSKSQRATAEREAQVRADQEDLLAVAVATR